MNGKDQKVAEGIMKELQLLPWELWEAKAIARNLDVFQPQLGDPWDPKVKRELTTRGIGRTTRILIGCLVEMFKGREVYFSAKDRTWELSCVGQIKKWAERLPGIDPGLIRPHNRGNEQHTRAKGSKLYVDHYV